MEFEIVETLREGEPRRSPSRRDPRRKGPVAEHGAAAHERDRAIMIPEQEDG